MFLRNLNSNTIFKSASRLISKHMSSSQAIKEQKVLVNNVNINYVQTGAGNKSVLLMPGALGSAWTDFKPQIEKLPNILQNFTIIAWDPPGYGNSIPPRREFTTDFFQRDADYAHNLMATLGHSRYSILGWSDGGITGLIQSAKYNTAVEKLVIWGSNSYIVEEEIKTMESIRDVNKWSARMREPMEKMYGKDGFAKLWSEWVDVYIAIYRKNNGDICKEELPKIKAPTLIVHGLKDPMIDGGHIGYFQNHIPSTEYYEFKDGKHNVHLRYADEFNKIVADFLTK